MSINSLTVSWGGLCSPLVSALERWSPKPASTEKVCQEQLANCLRVIAPDARVEREYLHCGCKIDVYISHKTVLGATREVFIEAKLNLSSENEVKRLIGQIELMTPAENDIILILFGKTKPEFLGRLREKYKPAGNPFFRPDFVILDKPFPNAVSADVRTKSSPK